MAPGKLPKVCVLSVIPRLHSLLSVRCKDLASSVTEVNPNAVDRSVLEQADIIVSEPDLSEHWVYGLPNLKLMQGTFAGVDR